MILLNKYVMVLGLGETGLSLVRWLVAQGARVRVADSRDHPPSLDLLQKEFPQLDVRCGIFRSELLDGIELIAISPGVPLRDPFVARAAAQGIPIVGDIELFALSLPKQNAPKIIAITGSNGKTTVTSMVGAMCSAAGKETLVAGNISPAVLDVLMQRNGKHPAVWVLELSSFQLETTSSLNADAATVLNISEDHMDRYDDMGEYIAAKARIFRADGHGGVQVLNRDDADSAAMALLERKHITFGINTPPLGAEDWGIEIDNADTWLVQGKQRVMKANELLVEGLHNVSNALAALALCRAIDLLVTRPEVDAERVAYVGHGLGALFGGILSGVERRIKTSVLMAGVGSFTDVAALSLPQLQGAELEHYGQVLAAIDPLYYVQYAAPAPRLSQFGLQDRFCPRDRFVKFAAAGSEPKVVKWYNADHDLSAPGACRDRWEWLRAHLNLVQQGQAQTGA